MTRVRRLLPALAVVAVTACSGGGGGATTDLTVASEDIGFDVTDMSAPAGTVTLTYRNGDDGVSHNLHVRGNGVDEGTDIELGPVVQTLTLQLDPGTYEFLCVVHPAEMTGTLTIDRTRCRPSTPDRTTR